MSDPIKHECGVAFIRLLKPLEYYQEKYGNPLWGLRKMQMLMTKQLNRGQDGAGLGVLKLNPNFGDRYIARKRSSSKNAISDIFEEMAESLNEIPEINQSNVQILKKKYAYAGEVLLGHLRYGTYGGNSIENIHPFLRQNNWMTRNLLIAGNYNVTNVDELFNQLIDLGQQPKEKSDNVLMLEKIGHFLDEENHRLFKIYKSQGLDNQEISEKIKDNLNIEDVLKRSFKSVDGGYNMVGMIGHGDTFVIRDPSGIRPSFYASNDEILVVASERSAIQTVFDFPIEDVNELGRGNALIIKKSGIFTENNIIKPLNKMSCSFERIYFSKGNDADIYKERKKLGELLSKDVLKHLNNDFQNTVFSYVPNTASTAFYGLIDGVNKLIKDQQEKALENLSLPADSAKIKDIISWSARREKLLIKDVKMRTFITNDNDREDMVGHVYDISYGIIKPGIDNVVITDDSIVRGTTLRTSILRIVNRLNPKSITLISSSPQIRYPDCYGIDMSKLGDFAAFQAAISLLKEAGNSSLLDEIYKKTIAELKKPAEQQVNCVKDVYTSLGTKAISEKIASMVKPKDLTVPFTIIYQNIANLHKACPDHKGDWYFTGNYPTSGGNRVANKAFKNYMEGKKERAY
jgi:amidophosphoribosyltransferase